MPLVYGATAWGLRSITGGWGYGYSYSNPYYVAPPANVAPVYDYTQPIEVNNYYETNAVANADVSDVSTATGETNVEPTETLPAPTPAEQRAFSAFDEALAAFKENNFIEAQSLTEQAIRETPNDPVLHEFYGLVLFSRQKYDDAAVVLNSLLAVAPGMDWTTMGGLYGDTETYTSQLRDLESYVGEHPEDAAAMFVLAYHYMVLDETEAAIEALKAVVQLTPDDLVARRMLTSLDGVPAAEEPAEGTETTTDQGEPTDIQGSWEANNEGLTITLEIKPEGLFTWVVKQGDAQQGEIAGSYELSADVLVLDGDEQGSMVGRVTSQGSDEFNFRLLETTQADQGLDFKRRPQ